MQIHQITNTFLNLWHAFTQSYNIPSVYTTSDRVKFRPFSLLLFTCDS